MNLYPFPGSEILNVLNSRPELAELENHVRTNIWHTLVLQAFAMMNWNSE